LVHPQLVRVRHAAGQQQRVVLVRVRVAGELVDREPVRLVQVVEPLDLPVLDRDQLHLRTGVLDRGTRLHVLADLDPVGGQDRDLLAAKWLVGHGYLPLVVSRRRSPSAVTLPPAVGGTRGWAAGWREPATGAHGSEGSGRRDEPELRGAAAREGVGPREGGAVRERAGEGVAARHGTAARERSE